MIDDMNDDNIVEPNDPQFDAWIESVAPSLNAPPVTPRLEMWDAIAAAQTAAVPGVLRFRRARWIVPTAIAAALLIGVGIDRFAARSERVASITPRADGAPTSPKVGGVTPSETEVARALRLVELFDETVANGRGVCVDDGGKMVDEAVVRAARRTLLRVGQI